MAEKIDLLKRIKMYDFILNELVLYLDTHPDCQQGLAHFRKYNELRNKAYEEYAKNYGPLMVSQATANERWNWIDTPWPWEKEANI
ncbi:MAG: spore coat protein CotJB [Oscillospiraceae bacterium]|jgi:spore coat protein JB|nr:spore coat protein CotJB [Oscillospiraceae bacterium]